MAHVQYLLVLEVASGTYDMDTGNVKSLERIAMFFNFELSEEFGGGASVFSRAVAQLGTRALNMAQGSASWLTRNALRITHQWSLRLNEDDTVSMSALGLFKLSEGFLTSVSIDFSAGKVKPYTVHPTPSTLHSTP